MIRPQGNITWQPRGSAPGKSGVQAFDVARALTPSQRGALRMLAAGPLFRNRDGWSARGRGCVTFKVMRILIDKGLAQTCFIETPNAARTFNMRGVRITPHGRAVAMLIPEDII